MKNFITKEYDNVDKITTKAEKKVSQVKSKVKTSSIWRRMRYLSILAGVVIAFYLVTLFNNWSVTHKIRWQIPLRTPVWIEEIKPIRIEIKVPVIITPTPPFKKEGDVIVPNKQSVVPFKKFLTNDGAQTREKVLALASSKYSGDELVAFDNILKKEAGYRLDAVNEIGCGGIGQACPASKMGCPLDSSGLECQTKWVMSYIENRYGDPVKAYQFHQLNNYY